MIRIMTVFVMAALLMMSNVNMLYSEENPDGAAEKDIFQKVNFMIDFSDYQEGSVEKWLQEKGFQFERDARDRKKLDLEVGEEGLILDVKTPMLGLIVNEGVDLEEFTSIRIEWGVTDYPEGASYEEGVRNEALMVIVFFGYDKISSGSFLIPNAPYFIGFFLGREETVGKAYVGSYFKNSCSQIRWHSPAEASWPTALRGA
jgi:hypothetical protein